MKEAFEWKKHRHTHSSSLNLLWRKLPSRQQVTGSLIIGGGIGCLALRLVYNFPGYDNLGAILIILGIVKFHEENIPLFINTRPQTH